MYERRSATEQKRVRKRERGCVREREIAHSAMRSSKESNVCYGLGGYMKLPRARTCGKGASDGAKPPFKHHSTPSNTLMMMCECVCAWWKCSPTQLHRTHRYTDFIPPKQTAAASESESNREKKKKVSTQLSNAIGALFSVCV